MLNPLPVKIALALLFLIWLNIAFGQDKEQPPTTIQKPINITSLSNFSPNKQKRWIRIDEVVVETINLALTPTEEQLAQAESTEIKALLKRDPTALKNIWLHDFTQAEPHNKVHNDTNLLPHYLSLHRRIERILIAGNHVYVSGMEYAVQIKEENTVQTQVAQKYTHLWIKELFGWRLASKRYD